LQSAGIAVVIASRFGDIFRGNAVTRQLWPVQVAQDVISRLWDAVEANPWLPVTIDLARLELLFDSEAHPWELDAPLRQRLLHPVGVIDDILLREEYIAAYEARHPAQPVLRGSQQSGRES
jgi:3-isopropylmalate/(R)-2-methylmalate dehydratase small subunit